MYRKMKKTKNRNFELMNQLFKDIPSLNHLRISNELITINRAIVIRVGLSNIIVGGLTRQLQIMVKEDITESDILNIIRVKNLVHGTALPKFFSENFMMTRDNINLLKKEL